MTTDNAPLVINSRFIYDKCYAVIGHETARGFVDHRKALEFMQRNPGSRMIMYGSVRIGAERFDFKANWNGVAWEYDEEESE